MQKPRVKEPGAQSFFHLRINSRQKFDGGATPWDLSLSGEKKTMRKLPVLLLAVLVTAFTCKKTTQEEEQLSTYSYKQTQCADAWQNSVTDSITLAHVTSYLAAQGLYVASLQIKADDVAAVCLACQCKTGKTIYVTSYNNDSTKTKFLALGFQQ